MDSEVTWSLAELQDEEGFILHVSLPGDENPLWRVAFFGPHIGLYWVGYFEMLNTTCAGLQVARPTVREFLKAFAAALDPNDEFTHEDYLQWATDFLWEKKAVYEALTELDWREKRSLQVSRAVTAQNIDGWRLAAHAQRHARGAAQVPAYPIAPRANLVKRMRSVINEKWAWLIPGLRSRLWHRRRVRMRLACRGR